ncbi:Pyridoxal kinase [Myotis brandtii]|uniref:pyridoxal kinase n=1 Tax=Myotis brandtii TaxID=109478 RepID=S7PL15_MYOBR|nr:Pyridoxal kinase [Myotis brandtii]
MGNRAAMFLLQVLGFEIEAVNSVQFSNHTGNAHWKGQVLNAEELQEVYEGLKLNNVNKYDYVLMGSICMDIHKVDTVFVGTGDLFAAMLLVWTHRHPNNLKVACEKTVSAVHHILQRIIKCAKAQAGEGWKPSLAQLELRMGRDYLIVLGSQRIWHPDGSVAIGSICMDIHKVDAVFVGTGDLFAAMLLVRTHRHPNNLKVACEKTVSAVHHILQRIIKCAKAQAGEGWKPSPAQLELRMVQQKGHQRTWRLSSRQQCCEGVCCSTACWCLRHQPCEKM